MDVRSLLMGATRFGAMRLGTPRLGATRFWRIVAVMGALGAGAVLAHSFLTPDAEPEPAAPRKRPSRTTRPATRAPGDDARRNGHGRAH